MMNVPPGVPECVVGQNPSASARIWAVDRGTGASQRPGSLPALRVACRYSPVGFDRQQEVGGEGGVEPRDDAGVNLHPLMVMAHLACFSGAINMIEEAELAEGNVEEGTPGAEVLEVPRPRVTGTCDWMLRSCAVAAEMATGAKGSALSSSKVTLDAMGGRRRSCGR